MEEAPESGGMHSEAQTSARALEPEHVAAILDLSADAILTLGPDERITSWNRGARDMFGFEAAEIVGRHFSALMPRDELERGELEWIRMTTLAHGAVRDHETRRRHKDGSTIPVSLTRTAVFDDRGDLVGFSAVLRDLRQRKRYERELLASERLATVGQVAAGVAQEMGAPLTAIRMAAEHVRRTHAGEGDAEDVRHLISEVDRLARLTRALINIAKPTAAAKHPVSIGDVAKDAVEVLREQMESAGVELKLEIEPDLPPVLGDAASLERVIVNLLLNARTALGERGGHVGLSVWRFDGGSVAVRVRDDGPGIPPADRAWLFTPFFSRFGGPGVGLAHAAQIVSAHGGSLTADPPEGGGASFTVRLPVHADA